MLWRGEEWYGGEECVRVEECCGEVRSVRGEECER